MDYRNNQYIYNRIEEFASLLNQKLNTIRKELEEYYVDDIDELTVTHVNNFFSLIRRHNLIPNSESIDIDKCVDIVVDNIEFVDSVNYKISSLFDVYIPEYGSEAVIFKILSCCDIFRILSVLDNIDALLLQMLNC